MSKERYNKIIDEVYEKYLNNFIPINPSDYMDVQPDFGKPMSKEWFILSLREKNGRGKKFSEKWGLKIEERELTEERRYNIWSNNNYETGMERFFNPEELPDYDNSYYEPTPKKEIIVTYQNEKMKFYE